jgi:hypothetical protein
MQTKRRLDSDRTALHTALTRARPRYLVVDRETPDADTPLPSGGRAKVVASFHTPDLAYALVDAEEKVGRTLDVVDSQEDTEQEEEGARQSGECIPVWSRSRSPVPGKGSR